MPEMPPDRLSDEPLGRERIGAGREIGWPIEQGKAVVCHGAMGSGNGGPTWWAGTRGRCAVRSSSPRWSRRVRLHRVAQTLLETSEGELRAVSAKGSSTAGGH
ncbi:hypothetical protein GCM10010517_41410 [Streptosporangium fragile]|uniref:Uncharacterized protein n=1 Tax=Streptosporangium fragile TaxID=46186 RepID=A0ABN3VZI7_9ACTN